jgi:hypothetical protein
MPAINITDAWLRNLTWAKAINRHRKPDKPEPKQITFIDTIDRGLALVLVIGVGGDEGVSSHDLCGRKGANHKNR